VSISIRRAYEPPGADDGYRVLVDRLWPRGVSRESMRLEGWARDVAPSNELRKWFHHEAANWPEFRRRYEAELAESPAREEVQRLAAIARDRDVTLVYGAKDAEHNQAVVLADRLSTAIAGR
jgi:uncharacterized protein YeaO (DUF488 family)